MIKLPTRKTLNQIAMVLKYLRKNSVLYLALFAYLVLLTLNAFGVHAWLPSCPVYAMTGHECFGCGLNRAAIALISFNFREALLYNPLIFLYLPVILWFIIGDYRRFIHRQLKHT